MEKMRRAFVSGHLRASVLLVVFMALFINVFVAHDAMAGGVIMIGYSSVLSGTDRATGEQYPPASMSKDTYIGIQRFFPSPNVIKVYQGDWVQFLGVAHNVDPFPIPGLSRIQMHYKGFNDPLNPGNLLQYYNRNIVPGTDRVVLSVGTGVAVIPEVSNYILQPAPVHMVGPGSNIPGKQYCQFTSSDPTFYLGIIPVWLYTEWKIPDVLNIRFSEDFSFKFGRMMSCAEIAYNYDLTPSIDVGISNDVTLAVQNTPQKVDTTPTYTQPTKWEVNQFIVKDINDPQVQSLVTGDPTTSSNDPCTFMKSRIGASKISSCEVSAPNAKSNGANTIFNKDGNIDSNVDPRNRGTPFPLSLPAPPPGSAICYVFSVSKYQPYVPSPGWRHSKIICKATTPKKPKVQVRGDDIRVGGKIDTSQTILLDQIFGSWGQYASYSTGKVTGFATASGLKGGKPEFTDSSTYNVLTFANATGTSFGEFSNNVNSKGLNGIKNFFTPIALSKPGVGLPSVDLSSLDGSRTPYLIDNGSTNIDILGGTIAKGKTVIIVATGSVTIKSDINYSTDPMTSLGDLPQVVIVAKNISIDKDVTNVDAWLVADSQNGVINTCSPYSASDLTSDICNTQLKVNGPVVTKRLLLYRTHGSDGNTPESAEEPAEIFNNRGDSYLWAYNYIKNNQNLISTNQLELPPRF